MSHKPTDEQSAIVDAFATGSDLVVEAGAGAGKTSTLKLCAGATPNRRGVYLAYNKAIATDAARSFPSTITCKTAHSYAYGSVGREYSHRLKAPRQPAQETARILGINDPVTLGTDTNPRAPQQLARIVTATIDRYCRSADERIDQHHVPWQPGIDTEPQRAALTKLIVPIAQQAWDTDLTKANGKLRFTHDCYLKIWALGRPQLSGDFVFLDEAQDANPVIADLVNGQRNTQRVLVGDACQAIYGWRGAIDAMATFTGKRLYLSQSFRFGPAVANEANKWLSILSARLRLRGFDKVPSVVGPGYGSAPDAVLCRTNVEVVNRAASAISAGRKAAIVGGGEDIRRLAEAAKDLKAGRPTSHPELLGFTTWAEVKDHAENDTDGSNLSTSVRLIDTYGPDGVIAIIGRLVSEEHADVTLSTAHKAKGREWGRVLIADDFREPKAGEHGTPGVVPREDAMLAYVAVTRAKRHLDQSGLAWVDRYVPS